MIRWDDDAWAAVEQLFADPAREVLADRLEELLQVLGDAPHSSRVRRIRMQAPALWAFTAGDSRETWTVLWEYTSEGDPYVHFAGPGLA